jgi:hypothetical protein
MKSAEQEMRPFYFLVVMWGKRFRDYLVDYCLPSLLSPGNIPSLIRGPAHKFLICTTPEDWRAMQDLPIFRLLREYVEPVLIEIRPPPPGRSACEHMGVGHKLATEMCFRDGAYGVALTPDLMLSDGTMAAAQRHALAGKEVVFVAAQRFAEEPLFVELRANRLIDAGERLSGSGVPLTLTGRQLVRAAVKSFHSEMLTYEWDAPYFWTLPAAAWWRVPGEDGIVMHSLSWAPLLLDYAAVSAHDTQALESWTMDGDYVWKNFANTDRIHVVQDSDEAMLVSWGPESVGARDLRPSSLQRSMLFGELTKGSILRTTYFNPIFDPIKRRIFPLPVRWHADDLSPAWTKVENRARRLIDRYILPDEQLVCAPKHPIGDVTQLPKLTIGGAVWRFRDTILRQMLRLMSRTRLALLSVWGMFIIWRAQFAYYFPIVLAAAKGDRLEIVRIARSVKRRLGVVNTVRQDQS